MSGFFGTATMAGEFLLLETCPLCIDSEKEYTKEESHE